MAEVRRARQDGDNGEQHEEQLLQQLQQLQVAAHRADAQLAAEVRAWLSQAGAAGGGVWQRLLPPRWYREAGWSQRGGAQ